MKHSERFPLTSLVICILCIPFLACRRSSTETALLDFDAKTTPGIPGTNGWSTYETLPDGTTFVWAVSPKATLTLLSAAAGDRVLKFRCWPFGYAGGPEQTMTPFLNGQTLKTFTLTSGNHEYRAEAPKALWKQGQNELRLDFAYAEAPQTHGGGADSRTLAVAFDSIEVLPAAPSAKPKP